MAKAKTNKNTKKRNKKVETMEKSDILSGNTFSYFDVFEEKKGLILGTEVNDIKYIKHLTQYLAPSKNSMMSGYYNICNY